MSIKSRVYCICNILKSTIYDWKCEHDDCASFVANDCGWQHGKENTMFIKLHYIERSCPLTSQLKDIKVVFESVVSSLELYIQTK